MWQFKSAEPALIHYGSVPASDKPRALLESREEEEALWKFLKRTSDILGLFKNFEARCLPLKTPSFPLTPIEMFQKISELERRKLFFKSLSRGDILYLKVLEEKNDCFKLLAIDKYKGCMKIDDLSIVMDLPKLPQELMHLFPHTFSVLKAALSSCNIKERTMCVTLDKSIVKPEFQDVTLGPIYESFSPHYLGKPFLGISYTDNLFMTGEIRVRNRVPELSILGIKEKTEYTHFKKSNKHTFSRSLSRPSLRKNLLQTTSSSYYKLAATAMDQGKVKQAAFHLKHALHVWNENSDALILTGKCYNIINDTPNAFMCTRKVLESYPTITAARKDMSRMLVDAVKVHLHYKNKLLARECLDMARIIDPENADAILILRESDLPEINSSINPDEKYEFPCPFNDETAVVNGPKKKQKHKKKSCKPKHDKPRHQRYHHKSGKSNPLHPKDTRLKARGLVHERPLLGGSSLGSGALESDKTLLSIIELIEKAKIEATLRMKQRKVRSVYMKSSESSNFPLSQEMPTHSSLFPACVQSTPNMPDFSAPQPTSTNFAVPQPPSTNFAVPRPPSTNFAVPRPPSTNFAVPKPPSTNFAVPKPPSNNFAVPKPPSTNFAVPKPPSTKFAVPKPSSTTFLAPKPISTNFRAPEPISANFPAPQPQTNSVFSTREALQSQECLKSLLELAENTKNDMQIQNVRAEDTSILSTIINTTTKLLSITQDLVKNSAQSSNVPENLTNQLNPLQQLVSQFSQNLPQQFNFETPSFAVPAPVDTNKVHNIESSKTSDNQGKIPVDPYLNSHLTSLYTAQASLKEQEKSLSSNIPFLDHPRYISTPSFQKWPINPDCSFPNMSSQNQETQPGSQITLKHPNSAPMYFDSTKLKTKYFKPLSSSNNDIQTAVSSAQSQEMGSGHYDEMSANICTIQEEEILDLNKSPDRSRRSRTPRKHRGTTPPKKHRRTCSRNRYRSGSPRKRRSHSPKKQRSRSPRKQRSRSPRKQRSRSPRKQRSRSPRKLRSRSPIKDRDRSPRRSYSRRDKRNRSSRSRSPRRHRSLSHSPRRYKSQNRSISSSSDRSRSRSRSISPMRYGSMGYNTGPGSRWSPPHPSYPLPYPIKRELLSPNPYDSVVVSSPSFSDESPPLTLSQIKSEPPSLSSVVPVIQSSPEYQEVLPPVEFQRGHSPPWQRHVRMSPSSKLKKKVGSSSKYQFGGPSTAYATTVFKESTFPEKRPLSSPKRNIPVICSRSVTYK